MASLTTADRDEIEGAFKSQHARILALKEEVMDAEDKERRTAIKELMSAMVGPESCIPVFCS
jgi:hypothetical protein